MQIDRRPIQLTRGMAVRWLLVATLVVFVGVLVMRAVHAERRQAYWDRKVAELCKHEAGIKVFQAVQLVADEFKNLLDRHMKIAVPHERSLHLVRSMSTQRRLSISFAMAWRLASTSLVSFSVLNERFSPKGLTSSASGETPCRSVIQATSVVRSKRTTSLRKRLPQKVGSDDLAVSPVCHPVVSQRPRQP